MDKTSLISQIALALSVPVNIALCFVVRPAQAAVFAVLASELFLPELTTFKFPFMPPLDKHNIPYVCVMIGCLIRSPGRVTKIPKERWFLVLTSFLVAGGVLTALTNRDMVRREFLTPLPGLSWNDGFYLAASSLLTAGLPFFIGYSLFKKGADLRTFLIGFSMGAFVYIPLELWEMRMSPNLHHFIYGFFQDDFGDTRRWGGYRPMVFMRHGLALARFLVSATLAPFVFGVRSRSFLGVPWKVGRWILVVVLVLCKSTGALIYTALSLPLLIWSKPKRETRIAFVMAVIVFSYPALRLSGWFPTQEVLQISNAAVGPVRTQSVEFRFQNEDKLAAHARERALFGWGQYGRNFTYDRYGHSSITDGYWIIEFGVLGVIGFVAAFGILLVPIYLCHRRIDLIPDPEDRKLVAGATLILAIIAADLLPNGLWGLYPYMLAGALTGVTRELALTPAPEIAWERV